MWEWLERVFGENFMPHGHCYLWSPAMVWAQVTSNLLIFVAYAAIAGTLALLVRRIKNIPFAWVYLAFGTFILSCGLTHAFDVITVWHPIYWADAGVRAVTATASVATAVLLLPLMPKVVAFADAARLSMERGRLLETAHALLESAHDQLATRERDAQRRASTSEGQLRSLVQSMAQLAWITSGDGKHLFRNQRWYEYTGLELKDPGDAGWLAVHHPDTLKHTTDAWQESLATKKPYEVEALMRRHDGEYRWFLLRAMPVQDDAGNVLSWMGTCTDIHDQKLLHEEALRTARMKDEFLATVSHELRTPLNAILGWSRLLKAGTIAADQRQRALDSVERNAITQARLVDDLLDVSRIISGKMRIDPRPIDPADAVDAALDTLRATFLAKGVELSSKIDHAAGVVLADSDRVQQVIWNLVGNAVKFTPKGGRVTVTLGANRHQLEIRVSDTGIGIKREFVPYLFDSFAQEDGSIRRAHGGLGLGLAISKHLVELHGGQIEVDGGNGADRGATFTVSLPLADASTQVEPLPPSQRGAHRAPKPELLRGLRLLLVEDDVDSSEVVSSLLGDAGVSVTTAMNAEQALRLLGKQTFDVIVSDVGLPGQDGYSFIRSVRRMAGLGQVPAAALTAYAHGDDRRRALEAGFQMHLAKPFDQFELFAAVGDLAKLAAEKNG